MARFDLQSYCRNEQAVAAVVSADSLFGLLSRHVELPPDWAALVTSREGDQRLVGPGGTIDRGSASQVLLVRVGPLPLELAYERLATRDGYQCHATVRLQVSIAPEPAELGSLQKTILATRDRADRAALAEQLRWQIHQALTSFAQTRSAGELIDGRDQDALQSIIRQKTRAACFAAGLTIAEPVDARFACPAYQKVRQAQQAAARQRDQYLARQQLERAIQEARRKHLAELQVLLEQLQTTVKDSPQLSLLQLIRTFNQSQRGQLYEALTSLLPPQQRTGWIVAAAGSELLWFERPGERLGPERTPSPARRISLSDELGPLRSVQAAQDPGGQTVLLVGAHHGLHIVEPDAARTVLSLGFAPRPELRGGINAATLVGSRVLASHSEAGLLCWSLEQPGQVRQLLARHSRDARAVRHVQADPAGWVWLSIDQRVVRLPADQLDDERAVLFGGCDDLVSALTVAGQVVYAATQSGQIVRWQADRPDQPEVIEPPRGRPIESLQWLCLGGINRLIIPDAAGGLLVQVLGDTYRCAYRSDQPIRFARAGQDLLLGVNDRRDRAYLWRPEEPDEPPAVLHIGRLCGHTIQDVLLLPQVS